MAAAESVGISCETFRLWMNDNLGFFGAVTRAEAEAEAFFTQTILKAAQGTPSSAGDWRAAESWLKRRRRADWGDKIDISLLSDEDILVEIDRRVKAREGTSQEGERAIAG